MKNSIGIVCLWENIKNNSHFIQKFMCLNKQIEAIESERDIKKDDQACVKCEQNHEIEELKDTNPENLFYFIDKLDPDVLKENFNLIIKKIENDAKNNLNRSLVCFDRLLTRIEGGIEFSKLKVLEEKDERFRFIIVNLKEITEEKLNEYVKDKDDNVYKLAISKLKNNHNYDSVSKYNLSPEYLNRLQDFFDRKDIKAEEERIKAEEERIKAEEERIKAEETIKQVINDGQFKLLLYISKAMALDEKSNKITSEHLQQATDYIEFEKGLSDELAKIICEGIGENKDKKDKDDFTEWLIKAYKSGKIEYDENVKSIVEKLKPYMQMKICKVSQSNYLAKTTLCDEKPYKITFKDILLLAKWIAHSEKSEVIKLEHIQKASVNFEITDEKLKELLGDTSQGTLLEKINEKIKEALEIDTKLYEESYKKSNLYQWIKDNPSKNIGTVKNKIM